MRRRGGGGGRGRGVRKISAGGGVTSPPSRESPDKVAN